MKNLKLALALLLAGSLLGAGCSFKSIEETQIETKSPAEILLEQREDKLAKKEADLKKKEAALEKEKEELIKEDGAKEEKGMDEELANGVKKDADSKKSADVTTDEKKNLNDRGWGILNPITLKADDTSIVVMLIAGESYVGKSEAFKIGCDDLLVPFKIETGEKTQSDLATAVVTLLTSKRSAYEASDGLVNYISGAGLILANVKYEDGKRIVEFEGEPTTSGACESPRIKAQLEETIALYSSNFEIRLNDSEANWRCLFDESGQCE